MHDYNNRHWVILPATAIDAIDFANVCETSPDTVSYSVDGSQFLVKYDVEDMPADIAAVTTVSYSHSEILQVLENSTWTTES